MRTLHAAFRLCEKTTLFVLLASVFWLGFWGAGFMGMGPFVLIAIGYILVPLWIILNVLARKTAPVPMPFGARDAA